jgi:cytochrome oxidase Cu insertion factor (SCO1/SenC/PrrC family)
MHRLLPATLLAAACGPKTTVDDTGLLVAPGEHAQGFEVGEVPPDFTLVDADGVEHTLSDYEGQRIAVVGTASW